MIEYPKSNLAFGEDQSARQNFALQNLSGQERNKRKNMKKQPNTFSSFWLF
jgi:hypothetical protein